MKKSELKDLIKQCLLEMVDDGELSLTISAQRTQITEAVRSRRQPKVAATSRAQTPRIVERRAQQARSSALDEVVSGIAKQNPMLAALVADTGRNTALPPDEGGLSVGMTQVIPPEFAADGDPEAGFDISVFDGSSKWSQLLDLTDKK